MTAVDSGSGAARGGLRPGDLVTAINGHKATSAEQLTVAELGTRGGRAIDIAYLRDGRETSVTLVPTRLNA